jgi:tryptophanyl-tRNA synthetase
MADSKKILLSGLQPSGRPHIGNYFGAMRQQIEYQNEYETFLMIADYHALTTVKNPELLREDIFSLAVDYLAIGLDPSRAVLFQQSSISEHTEATWIFNCLTPVAYLQRAHAFKDAEQKAKEVNMGLFDYPMLMAADILLYDADIVPVGEDQRQHIEYARDTAVNFNHIYGEAFKQPEALIKEEVGTIPGTDGRKMSKSYGNTIPLFAEDEEIDKVVMSIVTDSKQKGEPLDPAKDNIFALHKLFACGSDMAELHRLYLEGSIGYKESKSMLAERIKNFVAPFREKRKEVSEDRERVLEVLRSGSQKARERASKKMDEVRRKVGVVLL